MSWGFLGPITIRFGKSGSKFTVFGAWFGVLPLAGWWLSSSPGDSTDHAAAGDWLESDK